METTSHEDAVAPASGRSRLFEAARVELSDRYLTLAGLHFVETGTTRRNTPTSMEGDGWGTRWWGWFAKRHGCTLETIDIDPDAIAVARDVTRDYAHVITYTCADSVTALGAKPTPIHLLYLDSFDSGPGSPEHHIAEARAALPRLAEKAVVVLDDTRETGNPVQPWVGKGTLAIPFFVEHGFTIVAVLNGGVVLARGETAPGVTPLVRLHVDEYRTGWAREIRREGAGVWIDAHAPSTVCLTSQHDGVIVIRGGVVDGGNTRGQLRVDGVPVSYGEMRTVNVTTGQALRLTVDLVDGRKDQCWNYWHVSGAEVRQHPSEIPDFAVRPFPTEFTFRTHTRLGDGIGVLTALDCYCAANGIAFVLVDGGSTFAEIAALFEFRHVVIGPAGPQAFDADELFGQASWHEPWAKRIVRRLRAHFGGIDADVAWPRVRISGVEKEDVVLGQFDTRSAAPLATREIRAVIRAVAGDRKFALVGGPDTTRYLGECEYRLGDLEFIVRQLLACRCFVGVDSGVAHLAGTLGVPAYVVNAIDLDVVQKMFAYPNMTILDRAEHSGLPVVTSREISAITPRSEIWVAGMPSRGGGADTELDHQIDLWRMHGVEVHIVPISESGAYLPSPTTEVMQSCLTRGCHVHRYTPEIFAGKIVISFCNGPFLAALPEIVEAGRPDCVIWVNCMTWLFDAEKRAHAKGWIDLHAYQSQYQRDLIVPQLERLAPVHELPYRAFYNVHNAQQAVRFTEDRPADYFAMGRISRNDPAKFAPETWRIFENVVSSRPKRATILGYDSRVEQRLGPPPADMDSVTYPVGAYPVEKLLSELHVMIHKTGGSRENWPRTLLEAYNAGVVPIFENDFGCREMIIDGVTGFLCDTSDEMSARASQLAADEPLRRRMAAAGYRHLTETLSPATACWDGWRSLLVSTEPIVRPVVAPTAMSEGPRPVIDCITATRSRQTSGAPGFRRIEFSVWINVAGLVKPVTARVLVAEVLADHTRPLTAPIQIGPIEADGMHHHLGEVTDIEAGAHHRLTVRVHDGAGHEHVGSLDITRDDFEEMVVFEPEITD